MSWRRSAIVSSLEGFCPASGRASERPLITDELCRDFGCSPASFYAWRKKYGDTTPDEAKRLLGQSSAVDHAWPLRHLEKENARLLRIVGQQRLELEGMKEVLAKKR